MKLLYLSCHSTLEYDELSLFVELGINVFTLGAYTEPNSLNSHRPAVPNLRYDAKDLAAYHKLTSEHPDVKNNLTKEDETNIFISLFQKYS